MARLALEHQIEFRDGLGEFLATIQFIGHQEVVENLVHGSGLGFLLGLGRRRAIAEHAEIASPPQKERAGGRAETPGLVEKTQGLVQVFFIPAGLTAGGGLCLGFCENQQELIAIAHDLGFLAAAQVVVKLGVNVRGDGNVIHGQRLIDRRASSFQIGGQIHAGIKRAKELGFIAAGDKPLKTGGGCAAVGLDAQLLLDVFQKRLGWPPQLFKRRLAPQGRQCLLEVEPRARPVAGGHGDPGTVKQSLPLLADQRAMVFLAGVLFSLAGVALVRPGHVELATQRNVVPEHKEHRARDRQRDERQKRHDGGPPAAPFPRALPDGCRSSVNRVAVDESAQVVRQFGRGVETSCRVFLQTLQADCFEVVGNPRLQLTRRNRLLLDDLTDRVDRIARLERRTTHQKLVEDRAEGIDVDGRANFPGLSPRLFRRHIAGGAEDGAALGLAGIVVGAFGQTKIGDFGDSGS